MIFEIVLEKVKNVLIFVFELFKMIDKYSKYVRRVGHAILMSFLKRVGEGVRPIKRLI